MVTANSKAKSKEQEGMDKMQCLRPDEMGDGGWMFGVQAVRREAERSGREGGYVSRFHF